MKSKSLWISLLIILHVQLNAALSPLFGQDTLVIFDNNLGRIVQRPKWLKEGSTVGFQVVNINPFMFTSNSVSESVTAEYNDGLETFQQAISSSNKSSDSESPNTEELSPIKKQQFDPSKWAEQQKILTKPDQITALLVFKNTLLKKISNHFIAGDAGRIKIDDVLNLDTFIVYLMNDPSIYAKKMMLDAMQKLAPIQIVDSKDIYHHFKKGLDSIAKNTAEIDISLTLLREINTELLDLDKAYGFAANIDTLQKLNNQVKAIYSGKNLERLKEKVFSIQINYQRISDAEFIINGNRISTISGDVLKLGDTLKIASGAVYKIIEPVTIRSYGGSRINFSAGFAGTFGPINGKDYFLLRNNDSIIGLDSSSQLKRIALNPVALVHLTFKIRSILEPGISIGLNPDFSNLSGSKMLLGASCGFSATNDLLRRIVLAGGVGVGYSDQLKPKYLSITDFSDLGSLSDDDLTEKALDYGWFVSLTFNFGSINTAAK